MKKRAQKSDLDAECKFADLPSPEIETACKYEYMRESQRLRDAVQRDGHPVLPSFLQENLNWYEVLRLMSALRKARFAKPWNSLKPNAKRELILTVSEWDEERKKSDPAVVIEDATPVRDLEGELKQLPHARLLAGMPLDPVWRLKPSHPELLRKLTEESEESEESEPKYF